MLKEARSRKGFTLIELLIVIAIILILIAIALPNFLEAQIRAKVTKTKAELRSLGIAMEEYFLDWKIYPSETEHDIFSRGHSSQGHLWLTSPIKYMASVPLDSFNTESTGSGIITYESGGVEAGLTYEGCSPCMVTWCIFSQGPDHDENQISSNSPNYEMYDNCVESYSPTNGSKSLGDIFIWGGDTFYIGIRIGNAAARGTYMKSPAAYNQGLCVDGDIYLRRMPPSLR